MSKDKPISNKVILVIILICFVALLFVGLFVKYYDNKTLVKTTCIEQNKTYVNIKIISESIEYCGDLVLSDIEKIINGRRVSA